MEEEACVLATLTLVSFSAYSSALKMGQYVPPKRRLTLKGLNSVISTAVRTSNPEGMPLKVVWGVSIGEVPLG
jgi:hypothetical protein